MDTCWWDFCSKRGMASGRDVTNQLIDSLGDAGKAADLRPANPDKGQDW